MKKILFKKKEAFFQIIIIISQDVKSLPDEIEEDDSGPASVDDNTIDSTQHLLTHHTSTHHSVSKQHHNTTTSQYPSFVENAHNPPLRTSTIITNEDQVLNEDDININDDNLHTTAATSPIIVKPTPITILPRKRHIIGDSASSPSLYNSKDFSSSTISLKTPRLHSDDTNLPTTTKIDGSSFLDSDDIFGQHVAISMRGMDNQHTKEYFKLKVQELIYQVQFGERL